MLEYLVLIFLVCLCISTYRTMTNNTKLLAITIICLYMILLMGLRYRVGMDTMNYMRVFNNLPSWESYRDGNFSKLRYEPGFIITGIFCKSICNEFWFFQLVIAAITNTGVFIFIYKYCRNPFVGILVYIVMIWLYFSTEIMREGVAVSIFLLNYKNLKSKKWIRYYFISLLSISFHYSAFITWLFPLVPNIRKSSQWYLIFVIFIIAGLPILEYLNNFLSGSISDRLEGNIANVDRLNMNWKIVGLIQKATVPVAAIYFTNKYNLHLKFKPFILLHILFCTGLFVLPMVFSRLTNYTIIFVCVYTSNLLSEYNLKSTSKAFLVFLLLISQSYHYYSMKDAWVPYHSIVNPIKDESRERKWQNRFGNY